MWAQHLLAPGDGIVLFGGGALIVASLAAFWYFATGVSPDVWVPVLVFVALLIVSVPWIVAYCGKDVRLRKLLLLALVLKLLFVFPRYYSNEVVYGGSADAGQYHDAARTLVLNVREGRGFTTEGSAIHNYSDETRVIGRIAGGIYLVIGSSQVGGYMAFSWISWVGIFFVFRAFRVAYPNAPPYRAAALLFFLPSMLYWPSSIGKDAIMLFGIGLLTLGISRMVSAAGALRGLLYAFAASWLILAIRPHLLVVALVGGAVALLARNSNAARPALAAASRVTLLLALIPLLIVGLGRMEAFFGSDGGDETFSVSSALQQTNDQTSQGGSAFETRPITSPVDVPVAIVSVLFRPFPFEVNSLPVLISSLEGTLILLMCFVAAPWIWRVVQAMRNNPLAGFAGGYVLAFVFAFSNVGNAGILARQRVQMFPLLMLLVVCAYEEHRRHLGLDAPEPIAEPTVPGPIQDPSVPHLDLSSPRQ